jgi:outer membrane protein OmpA-like peptidoglycan-associated protein
MPQSSRSTFNIVLLAAVLIAGVALVYTAVGQLWPRAGVEEELAQPVPDRVAGPVSQAEGDVAEPDLSTLDAGRMATPPTASRTPETVTLTLPNGAQVVGTGQAQALQAYLASSEAPGRRFEMTSVRFVGQDEVRQDPDGALTTLAAILNAYPQARVRVEVIERNPQMDQPHDRAVERAANVAAALVANGVPASRVTSRGVKSENADVPRVELVVTEK